MINLKRKSKYIVLLTFVLILITVTSVYASDMTVDNTIVTQGSGVVATAYTYAFPSAHEVYASDSLYMDGLFMDSWSDLEYDTSHASAWATCTNPAGSQFWESYGFHYIDDGTYQSKSTYNWQYY